jgi:radical SAM protein with 4Fe4S-binding SPASM domain
MPFDKYIDVLRQIKELKLGGKTFDWIRLDGSREPLLYKKIIPAIEEAKKRGFRIMLITNGLLLSSDISKALVDLKVDICTISITGASAEVYQHFQGYGKTLKQAKNQFETIISNVERLLDYRSKASFKIETRISYMLSPKSAHEFRTATLMWKEKGVNTILMGKDDLILVDKETAPNDILYYTGHFCLNSAVIASNGDVYPCCKPGGEGLVIGNCFENDLNTIFRSDSVTNFFEKIASLKYDCLPEGCRHCGAIANYKEIK